MAAAPRLLPAPAHAQLQELAGLLRQQSGGWVVHAPLPLAELPPWWRGSWGKYGEASPLAAWVVVQVVGTTVDADVATLLAASASASTVGKGLPACATTLYGPDAFVVVMTDTGACLYKAAAPQERTVLGTLASAQFVAVPPSRLPTETWSMLETALHAAFLWLQSWIKSQKTAATVAGRLAV